MPLIDFNPVAWAESAKNAGFERDVANALLSAALSAQITFLWQTGKRSWWGEGKAMQDAATAEYLTLHELEKNKLLTLTVPKDLLDAGNLSRFQTEEKTK